MKKTKILLFGNSFSEDMGMYIPRFCMEKNIDIDIHTCGYPACSVDMHLNFIKNDEKVYNHSSYNFDIHDWQRCGLITGKEMISKESWDIIVIQQASHFAPDKNSFGNVDEYASLVKSLCPNKKVKLYWQMTWPYPSFNQYEIFMNTFKYSTRLMYEAIVDNALTFIKGNPLFEGIIPSGTVIMNLLSNLGERAVYRDVVHLSYHIGRYAIGLAAINVLFGIDISEINYRVFSMPQSDKDYCVNAAVLAIKKPFESETK